MDHHFKSSICQVKNWSYESMKYTFCSSYSKTPIYRAPIYWIPRFTGPQFYPPKTCFVCKSVQNVPRYTVHLDLPNLIPFPPRGLVNRGFTVHHTDNMF